MPRFRFKNPVFSRLCGFCQLFPLDGGEGLAAKVVEHPVHALDRMMTIQSSVRLPFLMPVLFMSGTTVKYCHTLP